MTFRMIVQLWNTNTSAFVSCDADLTENYMYISMKFGTGVHVFCWEVGVFNRSSFQSVSYKGFKVFKLTSNVQEPKMSSDIAINFDYNQTSVTTEKTEWFIIIYYFAKSQRHILKLTEFQMRTTNTSTFFGPRLEFMKYDCSIGYISWNGEIYYFVHSHGPVFFSFQLLSHLPSQYSLFPFEWWLC